MGWKSRNRCNQEGYAWRANKKNEAGQICEVVVYKNEKTLDAPRVAKSDWNEWKSKYFGALDAEVTSHQKILLHVQHLGSGEDQKH